MRYFWEKLLQQIRIQEQYVLHREGGQTVGAICGAGLITPKFVLSRELMLSWTGAWWPGTEQALAVPAKWEFGREAFWRMLQEALQQVPKQSLGFQAAIVLNVTSDWPRSRWRGLSPTSACRERVDLAPSPSTVGGNGYLLMEFCRGIGGPKRN